MRIYTLAVSIAVASQLVGCAHQARYASNNGYPDYDQSAQAANYTANYPNQYGYQRGNSYDNSRQYQQPYQNNSRGYNAPVPYDNTVEIAQIISLREVEAQRNPSAAGAVVGALLGGVLGNQLGRGDGRAVATIGGAIAGGVVGNEIERSKNHEPRIEAVLRFSNGEVRSTLLDHANNFRIGDRVRVSNRNGQAFIVQ